MSRMRILLSLAAAAAAVLPSVVPAQAVIPPLPTKAGDDANVPTHFDHVVVLILENENFSATWGPNSVAHYLNGTGSHTADGLRPKGVFNEGYYATGHASLDNYIAMVSGQPNQPVTGSDCLAVNLWLCVQQQLLYSNGRNLADQLEEKGVSWKGYMDSMPSPCFHADYSPTAIPPDPYQGDSQTPPAKDYADRHNPFLYFPNIIEDNARCQTHVRPYTDLATDIANDTVPRFSFITPDTCHDGHDATCSNNDPGGLVAADKWLSEQVPALLTYLTDHNGLLLITLDENGFTDTTNKPGCCAGGPLGLLPGHGGRIGLLAVSPFLNSKAGTTVSTEYDHMSLLRTIEDMFGIDEYLNNASQAAPMVDVVS